MRHLTVLGVSIVSATLIVWPGLSAAQTTTKEKVEQKAETTKDKAKGMAESAKEGVSDSWITAKTKIALYADERVSGTQVSVDTKGGVVHLRGKVDTPDAKAAAEQVTKGVEGVKTVKNDLQVVAQAARKTVDANDKDIAKSVETKLHRDPQLKKVDARADAGVVTLTGEAATVAAAARASEQARMVAGVKAVKNEITFKSTQRQ